MEIVKEATSTELSRKLKKIASFSDNYFDVQLKERKEKIKTFETSAEESLKFIFSYVFFQGRRDAVSDNIRKAVEEVIDSEYRSIKTETLLPHDKEKIRNSNNQLNESLEKNGVKKESDRLMTIHPLNYLDYIRSTTQYNGLFDYSKDLVIKKEIKRLFDEFDQIWSIGPKIASLIIRDLTHLLDFHLEKTYHEYFKFMQPIDTWVFQVCKEVGIELDQKASYKAYEKNVKKIIETCRMNDVNPIQFNEGSWYLGSKSFAIVMDNLENLK